MLENMVAQFGPNIIQKSSKSRFSLKESIFESFCKKLPNIFGTFVRKIVAETYQNSQIWSHYYLPRYKYKNQPPAKLL